MLSLKRLIPALGAAALLSALAVPSAVASNTQTTVISDNFVQIDPTLTMDTFRGLGANLVKITIYWNQFAPSPNSATPPKHFNATDPAAYPAKNWAWLDAAVKRAAKDKLQVGFEVDAPAPIWAAGTGYQQHPAFKGSWNPSASDLEQFVKALGTRYSGIYKSSKNAAPLPRVSWWSIWNEPNFGFSLQPQSTDGGKTLHSAIEYRSLVSGAWVGLWTTGHRPPGDTILIGETAPRGAGTTNTTKWSAYNPGLGAMSLPLVFMSQLYCVGQNGRPLTGKTAKQFSCPGSVAKFKTQNPGLFQSSGWAIHPYGQGTPPSETTYECPHEYFCQSPNNRQRNPYFADFASIPNVIKTMDHLQSVYGYSHKMQLWNTEFGYWSVPPTKINPAVQKGEAINQTTAAYYMNWAEYLSYLNPRLNSYDQYQLIDPASGEWGDGLETDRGVKKPEWDAFLVPFYMPSTTASHATTLTVWGAIRPAWTLSTTGLHQQAQIQFLPASNGGRALSANTGNSVSANTGNSGKPKPTTGDGYRTVQTITIKNPRGYFDVKQAFTQSGTVRIAWVRPGGPPVYSRTQKITVG
jgi:hypothetical protein